MLSSQAAETGGTSRIHFSKKKKNFPCAICYRSAQHVNFSFNTSSRVEFGPFSPICHGDRERLWFPHSHLKFLRGVFRRQVPHQWIRSACWAVLQAHCGSSGMRAVGVEDGNPGLSVAELLNYSHPPTLPASIPLCSASTETSLTVWMNNLRLSPPLNLKWGCSLLASAAIFKEVATSCRNWTEITQKIGYSNFIILKVEHFEG